MRVRSTRLFDGAGGSMTWFSSSPHLLNCFKSSAACVSGFVAKQQSNARKRAGSSPFGENNLAQSIQSPMTSDERLIWRIMDE